MNGVCVMFKGYVDTQRLDGAGYLEYDEDHSKVQTLCFTHCICLEYLRFYLNLLHTTSSL